MLFRHAILVFLLLPGMIQGAEERDKETQGISGLDGEGTALRGSREEQRANAETFGGEDEKMEQVNDGSGEVGENMFAATREAANHFADEFVVNRELLEKEKRRDRINGGMRGGGHKNDTQGTRAHGGHDDGPENQMRDVSGRWGSSILDVRLDAELAADKKVAVLKIRCNHPDTGNADEFYIKYGNAQWPDSDVDMYAGTQFDWKDYELNTISSSSSHQEFCAYEDCGIIADDKIACHVMNAHKFRNQQVIKQNFSGEGSNYDVTFFSPDGGGSPVVRLEPESDQSNCLYWNGVRLLLRSCNGVHSEYFFIDAYNQLKNAWEPNKCVDWDTYQVYLNDCVADSSNGQKIRQQFDFDHDTKQIKSKLDNNCLDVSDSSWARFKTCDKNSLHQKFSTYELDTGPSGQVQTTYKLLDSCVGLCTSQTFKYKVGVSSTDTTTSESSWANSLAVGVEFKYSSPGSAVVGGKEGTVNIAYEHSRTTTSIASSSVTKTEEAEREFKYNGPGSLWQYTMRGKNSRGVYGEVLSKAVVEVQNSFRAPCCLPGFFADPSNPRGACTSGSPNTCEQLLTTSDSPVFQSSSYDGWSGLGLGGPEKAIDGNTSGSESSSFTHTNSEKDPWWWVNVSTGNTFDPKPVSVTKVIIWNRTSCCQERLYGAKILLMVDGEWKIVGTYATDPSPSQTFDVGFVKGVTKVMVKLPGEDKTLSLAEVQVFGIVD